MISALKKNKALLIKSILFLSITIPLGILFYELIYLGQNSVTFFKGYPTAISLLILAYYLFLIILGILRIISQFKSVLKLRKENNNSELNRLQSQVNPHFFFNMLNNLYGLVDKDPTKAQDLILQLSDLMRYSIYEGEKNQVVISEEINYLQNYIELHQMRYHKKIDIQFLIQIKDDQLKIRPLLFIILVENAFKHGVEKMRDGAYVHIHIKADEKMVYFEISNNFEEDQIVKKKGIGIKNLQRRLELAYPKKHELILKKHQNNYLAKLILKQ